MLSESEKAQIKAEEIYRLEIRTELSIPQGRAQRVLSFFNSNLGLWFLSAIFISGISAAYTTYLESKADLRQKQEMIRRLDIEISRRVQKVSLLGEGTIKLTQKEIAKAASDGTIVGYRGFDRDFRAIFQEFEGRSLFSLVWELQRTLPPTEANEIASSLQASKKIEEALDWFERTQAVTDESDSLWSVSDERRDELKAILSALHSSRWDTSSN